MTLTTSVIVPTRNRGHLLGRALRSLFDQSADAGSYEVLVVDNGSTDRTRAVADEAFGTAPEHGTRYVYEPVPGLLAGRHRGVAETDAELLVFVDDDIVASPGWLTAIRSAFDDPDVDLATGPCRPDYHRPPPRWVDGLWTEGEEGRWCGWYSLVDLGPEARFIHPNRVWGLNFAIRRETLLTLGGFHPDNVPADLQHYQGDGETGLTRKAVDAGRRAWWAPDAVVHHAVTHERLTGEYLRRRARYQGVADSFTQARERGGPSHSRLRSEAVRRVPSMVRRTVDRWVPSDVWRGLRLGVAYANGFEFHQRAMRRWPTLVEWVARDTYWDYRLPPLADIEREGRTGSTSTTRPSE